MCPNRAGKLYTDGKVHPLDQGRAEIFREMIAKYFRRIALWHACRAIRAATAGRISSWPVKHTVIPVACGKPAVFANLRGIWRTDLTVRSERQIRLAHDKSRSNQHVAPVSAFFLSS